MNIFESFAERKSRERNKKQILQYDIEHHAMHSTYIPATKKSAAGLRFDKELLDYINKHPDPESYLRGIPRVKMEEKDGLTKIIK